MNYAEKYAMYDKVLAIYAALGQQPELHSVCCGAYYRIDVHRVILKQLCLEHGYSEYEDYICDNKFVFYDFTEYFAMKLLSGFRVQARLVSLSDMTVLVAVDAPIKIHLCESGRVTVTFTQEFYDKINPVCRIGNSGVDILLRRYENANAAILRDVIFHNIGGTGKYKDCVIYFSVEEEVEQ